MKWVLKHRSNLKKAMASLDYTYQPDDDGAWSFEDINYYDRFPEAKHGDNRHEDGSGDDKEPPVKPKITDHFYSTILASSVQRDCVPEQLLQHGTGLSS